MHLFDIHTHNIPPENTDGYDVTSILNVFPKDYYAVRDSYNSEQLYSCGIHPWYANVDDVDIELLSKIATDKQVVAIGEVGLDKLKGESLDIQEIIFGKQIELAEAVGKPVIIHCVKAWSELIALHKKYNPTQIWIVHGYRGKPQLTEQLLAAGLKFSIGNHFNPESLKLIPMDSLFIETDDVDVSICNVFEAVSQVLNVDIDILSNILLRNARNIFR